jgi:glycosyltransferase involved in cell wall biosynthesis
VRILHVVATGQRRGAEVFAADLCRTLSSSDVEQRVVVLRSEGGLDVAFHPPVDRLGADGWSMPGLHLDVPHVQRLSSLARAWRPDVIQAHGGEALKYSLAATKGRTPLVYRRIGEAPAWITRGPRRVVHGWLMRRAARVITVAESVRRETMCLFGLEPGRVVTIPNGVDVARVTPGRSRTAMRRELGIPPDAPVLLSLGSLSWEKDPACHVEISCRVLRRSPGAVHLFVGDGPMRAQTESMAAATGMDGRVRFLGSRGDVGDILGASDALLFASRPGGMEGMPAVVIEAGLAELPVVGFAVAGVAEVVADGETGLLAPHGDREALATLAERALNDGPGRVRMGRAARARCLARFEIGAVAPRYLAVYREVAR